MDTEAHSSHQRPSKPSKSKEKPKLIDIKKELSELSFEQLLALKEEIGVKLLNEQVLGISSKTKTDKHHFKRDNKNRPREMSSKRPPHNYHPTSSCRELKICGPRDPRFDPLCGVFDKEKFDKRYKFVDKIKENEHNLLKKEMKATNDPQRQEKIRNLLRRFENQKRAKERDEKHRELVQKEKEENMERLKRGIRPVFKSKSEKRIEEIVNGYEELCKRKKLNDFVLKKNRKQDRQFNSRSQHRN